MGQWAPHKPMQGNNNETSTCKTSRSKTQRTQIKSKCLALPGFFLGRCIHKKIPRQFAGVFFYSLGSVLNTPQTPLYNRC